VGAALKESQMVRKYAKELKDQACSLVISEGYSIKHAAKQLGLCEATLRYWLAKRNWKGVRPMPESDDPKVLKARIVELEAKLRRAEMEREILKKATAYFASPHLPVSSGSASTDNSSR
jgi:transposase